MIQGPELLTLGFEGEWRFLPGVEISRDKAAVDFDVVNCLGIIDHDMKQPDVAARVWERFVTKRRNLVRRTHTQYTLSPRNWLGVLYNRWLARRSVAEYTK